MKKVSLDLSFFCKKTLIISIKNNKYEPLFSAKILKMINHKLGKVLQAQKYYYEIEVVKQLLNQDDDFLIIDSGLNREVY